jgi:hypothetical protein
MQPVPSARTIARLMTTGRNTLSKSETVAIAAIVRLSGFSAKQNRLKNRFSLVVSNGDFL